MTSEESILSSEFWQYIQILSGLLRQLFPCSLWLQISLQIWRNVVAWAFLISVFVFIFMTIVCLGMGLYVCTMKYEEITFNNWHFCGARSIKSSIRKLNSYTSDSLLTLCRKDMSDFSILVLCARAHAPENVSIIHTAGHGQFLDLHRFDGLGVFFFFFKHYFLIHWPTSMSLL